MAKNCINCNKKIGFNVISYDVDGTLICGDCYDKVKNFKLIKNYESVADFKETVTVVNEQMNQNEFNQETKDLILKWYDNKWVELEKSFQSKEFSQKLEAVTQDMINEHMVTTGFNFEGYKIVNYNTIVSGETVLGTGFLSEFSASFADTFGKKSNAFANKLQLAKDDALNVIITNSIAVAGNALIGVDFKYTMFNNNLIGVIATGTSVKIEKI